MKKFYIGIIGLVLVTTAALATNAPFPPWIEKVTGDLTFNYAGVSAIGSQKITEAMEYPLSATSQLNTQRVASFVYDVAVSGGTMAAHGLGVILPAKAVITRSYFKIITQFTDSGSGTIALSCEDANNIKTATDITGSAANAFIEGASTGAASTFVRGIGAACEITATPAGVASDAGKLVGWVEYVVED